MLDRLPAESAGVPASGRDAQVLLQQSDSGGVRVSDGLRDGEGHQGESGPAAFELLMFCKTPTRKMMWTAPPFPTPSEVAPPARCLFVAELACVFTATCSCNTELLGHHQFLCLHVCFCLTHQHCSTGGSANCGRAHCMPSVRGCIQN